MNDGGYGGRGGAQQLRICLLRKTETYSASCRLLPAPPPNHLSMAPPPSYRSVCAASVPPLFLACGWAAGWAALYVLAVRAVDGLADAPLLQRDDAAADAAARLASRVRAALGAATGAAAAVAGVAAAALCWRAAESAAAGGKQGGPGWAAVGVPSVAAALALCVAALSVAALAVASAAAVGAGAPGDGMLFGERCPRDGGPRAYDSLSVSKR